MKGQNAIVKVMRKITNWTKWYTDIANYNIWSLQGSF